MLVEVAWHYQHSPRVSPIIATRQDQLPKEITDIAWKAQLRLNAKYKRLVARRVMETKAVVAVARELAGFVSQTAPDPFVVRVTSLGAVSGPPLREPRRSRTQRQAARAGGAARCRVARTSSSSGRGALRAPSPGAAEMGQAAQAGF